MKFSEYQKKLARLEHERGWDRVLPSHTFLHMGEEMGEIARVLECFEGYRTTTLSSKALRDELAGELADLMAFLFKLANQYEIDMEQTMVRHLAKFLARHHDIEQGKQEMARYVRYQEQNVDWIKGAPTSHGRPIAVSHSEEEHE